MADSSPGKSIADAYRNSPDNTTAPPPASEGSSIADAYRKAGGDVTDSDSLPTTGFFGSGFLGEGSPAMQAWRSYQAAGSLHNWLAPTPNTEYSSTPLVPFALDTATGKTRWALPGPVRSLLYSATGDIGEGITVDPTTGRYGTTPEMADAINMLSGFGGRPLEVSHPLSATPLAEREAPLSPAFKANPLSPEAQASAKAPPAGPSSSTGIEPPPAVTPPTDGTSALVAPTAAPAGRITPIVTQAQAEAEADRILQHFAGNQPITIDSTPLPSGAKPTLSQSVQGGNAGLAALERGVRDVPEQTQYFTARETDNTAARNKAVGDVVGDSRATDVAEAELNNRTRPQEQAIFDPAKTQPVDPSDTIAAIDQILKGPQGQRDVVAASLQQLRSKLVDKNGNLQTDPALLRGVDLSIGDQISPKAAGTAHDGRAAAHELMAVRDVLRDNIEQGAPGYRAFLANQAAERSAIDGQRFLQARNITDRMGNVNLGTLDATIKAAETQQGLPGARLADGVTDEQLDRLKALRADYQNDAKQRLGTSIGSPTVQKLGVSGSMAAMGHPLLSGIAGAGGAYLAGMNPLLGTVLGVGSYLMKQQGVKAQGMVMDALRDKLLNPERARSAFQPSALQTPPPMSAAEQRLREQLSRAPPPQNP